MRGVADAMAHAHGLGVVHGDLNPANIAADADGHPYVLDWSGLLSAEGTFSGTPEFAAPEQLAGQPPTAASDVFAFACVAWELLTARPLRPVPTDPEVSIAERVATLTTLPAPTEPPAGVEPTLGARLVAAASPDPGARPTARELLEAIADALSGRARATRRRAEANATVAVAQRLLLAFHERERRLIEERRVIAVQRARIPPYAPASAKEGLWATERRAEALLGEQSLAWTEALEHAVAAAHLEPDLDEAHALIAELWFERLRMAEDRQYEGETQLARARIRRHDRGRFGPLLDAAAHVSLSGPDGCEVDLVRVNSDGWRLTEQVVDRKPLPLERMPLSPGSWLVVAHVDGRPSVTLSLSLQRLDHLQLEIAVPESVLEGFCYVPAGPFRMGGDDQARRPIEPCVPWVGPLWVARTCVTSEAYLAFLNRLSPEEAASRVPAEHLVNGSVVPLWPRADHGWQLPPGWASQWPVVGVSLDDAEAYARFAAGEHATGLALRVPTEEEWEKAARGADARPYPWGTAFDPSWCHMRDSVAGQPQLKAVAEFPPDRSPYGVCDVAGGVHEWTTSLMGADRVVVRGGSWASDAQACRLASRAGAHPATRQATVGIRLVADAG